MGELTKLPNIGSTVERQLEQAGIGTAEALRQLAGGAGSCRHAGDGGIPFRCTAHRSVTACYPAMPPKPFSSSMKAAPHALRGGPFASIIHSAFFLGSTAQMSWRGVECFLRQLQAADGGKGTANAAGELCGIALSKIGRKLSNAPGPYARRAGLPCRAAWMKPWDGAGHQVLSPLKSRVRSFTQRYLR